MADAPFINPLIAMGVRAPDAGPSVQGGLQNALFLGDLANRGRVTEEEQLRNQLLAEQVESAQSANQRADEEAELRSIFRGLELADLAFKQGGREGLIANLENRVNTGPTFEGSSGMSDTVELLNIAKDPTVTDEELKSNMDQLKGAGIRLGFIKVPEDKEGVEFRKEERKIAKDSVNNLKKRASEINSSFGKVESLVRQIKEGGSRAATGALDAPVKRFPASVNPETSAPDASKAAWAAKSDASKAPVAPNSPACSIAPACNSPASRTASDCKELASLAASAAVLPVKSSMKPCACSAFFRTKPIDHTSN